MSEVAATPAGAAAAAGAATAEQTATAAVTALAGRAAAAAVLACLGLRLIVVAAGATAEAGVTGDHDSGRGSGDKLRGKCIDSRGELEV